MTTSWPAAAPTPGFTTPSSWERPRRSPDSNGAWGGLAGCVAADVPHDAGLEERDDLGVDHRIPPPEVVGIGSRTGPGAGARLSVGGVSVPKSTIRARPERVSSG